MKQNQRMTWITGAVLIAAALVISAFVINRSGKQKDFPTPPAAPSPQKQEAKDTIARPKKTIKKKVVTVNTDTIIAGTLTDEEGKPVRDVVVSDCYQCTRTDSLGRYRLRRSRLSKFVYYTIPDYCKVPVHSETDHTAAFYQRLAKGKSIYNFRLTRLPLGKEYSYDLIVFGDPQVTNALNPYYTGPNDNRIQKSDVARFTDETMADVKRTLANATTPVYGISMGDDVQYYGGYNPNLERQIREALGSSRMTVFSVIGNHDQDGKAVYRNKWEENWGPTDYSFDRGDEHYVCFNNVQFIHSGYFSPGELTNAQVKWLTEDLRLTDKEKKVILCYHIPFTFGNSPNSKAVPLKIESEEGHYAGSRLSTLLKLLEEFRGGYELFCGHTHFAINHEIEYEGRHLLEHCHAAACGNIWQSNINICGTPNGYYVYSFLGTKVVNCYYKGTFWDRKRQMTLFKADTDFNGERYTTDWNLPVDKGIIIANVFNADSHWKVTATEDGVTYPTKRISHQGQDAFATGYHHRYSESVSYRFVSKSNGYLIMNHLYYYEPKRKDAVVTITATDGYGNTYTASSNEAVTQPFFNFAHYYKE